MAARFWVGGGSAATWAATAPTNWASSSGGSNNQTVPGLTDDVTFDGAGANGNTSATVGTSASCLSLTFTSGFTSSVAINNGQIITIAGNFTDNTAHTWTTFVSGALVISATSTITSGGKGFPGAVTFTGTNTKTLVGDWTVTGLLTLSGTTTLNKTTAEILSVGGMTVSFPLSGTGNITLTGGTWQGAQTVTISGTLNFAGNVTVSGGVVFNTGTLKYTSGTVTTTGSTITVAASTTFDTSGITWNNITFSGTSQTYTINSLLSLGGTLLLGGTTTSIFAGTAGWTTGTLSHTGAAAFAVTLKNSITYTITTAFTASTTRNGAILSFTSDDGTIKAILTMSPTAASNVLASFTRIDASAGRVINTFNGTITTSNNIFSFNDGLPSSVGRVSLAGATY